jgi:hypothetical protein
MCGLAANYIGPACDPANVLTVTRPARWPLAVPRGAHVKRLAHSEREAAAELVAFIGEIDARNLYLAQGMPSMFEYCRRVLHLDEGFAYNRIAARGQPKRHRPSERRGRPLVVDSVSADCRRAIHRPRRSVCRIDRPCPADRLAGGFRERKIEAT